MNDRQNPHGQQFYGYDAYGRPIYHDPYAGQPASGQGDQSGQSGQYAAYDPYAAQPGDGQGGTYGAGQYDTGAGHYDSGQYDAVPPSGPYDTGQYGAVPPPGPYDSGQYDAVPAPGQYDTGQYDTGQYDTGHYDSGQYDAVPPSGPYDTGQLPASSYDDGGYGGGAPDPYAAQPSHGGQPYGTGQPYGGGEAYAYAPPPLATDHAQQPYAPPAGTPREPGYPDPTYPEQVQPRGAAPGGQPVVPNQRAGNPERPGAETDAGTEAGARGDGYQTDEFSFVEEQEEDAEDVIDWLKFTESRTERREEARRRGRNRVVALVVVLTLALVGGLGYLWQAGKLPGFSDSTEQAATAADTRHVIAVHLRELESGDISTALLVNNETAGKGTTVLLPNSLALDGESGESTTLGKAFTAEGAGATRDSLNALLGADIEGTWRLDTPYLENLVELVGGITLTSDATVPGAKKGDKPLVAKGDNQELDGQAAVAYATHRDTAEPQTKQLARFGQVMQSVMAKLSTDKEQAASAVESLGQILDFSLTEAELGAALASLAEHAKNGDYKTELLPVQANGTLSEKTSQGFVKEVLGGSVKNAEAGEAVRLAVRNASGTRGAADGAQVTLVNGGFTVVATGAAGSTADTSSVTYRKAAHEKQAKEAAKTLGLGEKAVKQGEGAANADVTVVLGKDFSD